jgi:hypothetical protein
VIDPAALGRHREYQSCLLSFMDLKDGAVDVLPVAVEKVAHVACAELCHQVLKDSGVGVQ